MRVWARSVGSCRWRSGCSLFRCRCSPIAGAGSAAWCSWLRCGASRRLPAALAQNYQQMLAARLIVGIGEAAYGSVGLAVLLTVFPTRMRATVSGTFLAGGMIGSVLGISLGGFIAAHFGWRAAFAGMAAFGIVLTICYPLVVKERRVAPAASNAAGVPNARGCARWYRALRSSAPISAAACSCSSAVLCLRGCRAT